jgi:hypothetical protein
MPLHTRCSFLAALLVLVQMQPAIGSTAPSASAPTILATQLRRQGVVCSAPKNAELDINASIPHVSVWTLDCNEASYRITLVPDMRALIVPTRVNPCGRLEQQRQRLTGKLPLTGRLPSTK